MLNIIVMVYSQIQMESVVTHFCTVPWHMYNTVMQPILKMSILDATDTNVKFRVNFHYLDPYMNGVWSYSVLM